MSPFPRRHFLAQATALAALPLLSNAAENTKLSFIDCNTHLGTHPNRDLSELTADKLQKSGITEAWAAPWEALLHRDLAAVNARHVARCNGSLRPVGVVNPGLPDWTADLRRCTDDHGLKIIRLYPGYHGYKIDDERFVGLIELATARQVRIQIVAQLEDMRTQHPLLQIAPVDFKPLAAVLKQVPEARLMILNANAAMAQTTLHGLPNVWLDIAMIEGVAGIENLLTQWPADRLVFGTHAPFFYPESSLLKLQESELTEAQLKAVRWANAKAWVS